MNKEELLNDNHWRIENYRQRITIKQWRKLLLNDDDQIIFHGHLRKLIGKNLGVGVIEIFKEPLNGN